jgi:hypothetical protein
MDSGGGGGGHHKKNHDYKAAANTVELKTTGTADM